MGLMKFLLTVLIAMFSLSANAAYMQVSILDGEKVLTINGKIERGDYKQFKSLSIGVDYVLLQSNGGYVSEAIKIGKLINASEMNTITETYCVSACYLILVSGSERYVYDRSRVAVHRPFRIKNNRVIPSAIGGETYNEIAFYFVGLSFADYKEMVKSIYTSSPDDYLDAVTVKSLNKFKTYSTPIFTN